MAEVCWLCGLKKVWRGHSGQTSCRSKMKGTTQLMTLSNLTSSMSLGEQFFSSSNVFLLFWLSYLFHVVCILFFLTQNAWEGWHSWWPRHIWFRSWAWVSCMTVCMLSTLFSSNHIHNYVQSMLHERIMMITSLVWSDLGVQLDTLCLKRVACYLHATRWDSDKMLFFFSHLLSRCTNNFPEITHISFMSTHKSTSQLLAGLTAEWLSQFAVYD